MSDRKQLFCLCLFNVCRDSIVCVFGFYVWYLFCDVILSVLSSFASTVKPVSSGQSKKLDFQDKVLLNAGQKYCRLLPSEHSAILLTSIKPSFFIKIFVLYIFE